MTTWTLFILFFLFPFLEWRGYSVGAEKYDDNDEVNQFYMQLSLQLLPLRFNTVIYLCQLAYVSCRCSVSLI